MKARLISITILIVVAIFLIGCQAEKPPVGAIFAAFHFCPTDECSNVELGKSSKALPFADTTITDRWCVEVEFTRGGKSQTAAVEVFEIDSEAPIGFGDWIAADPIFNSDCKIFD